MKKSTPRTALACAVFLLLGGGWSMAVGGETPQAPAEPIVIEGKKPATFGHQAHLQLGLTCGQCHHDGQHQPLSAEAIAALPGAAQLACENCHNENFANAKLQKRMDVFHARCKGCHQEGVDGKKGPTKCSACHVKKSKKAIEGC